MVDLLFAIYIWELLMVSLQRPCFPFATMSLPVYRYSLWKADGVRTGVSSEVGVLNSFLFQICPPVFSHCLHQAKTEICERERKREWSTRRVAERKTTGMEDIALLLFHGRIETLKLRLEAPPLITWHMRTVVSEVCVCVCVCWGHISDSKPLNWGRKPRPQLQKNLIFVSVVRVIISLQEANV